MEDGSAVLGRTSARRQEQKGIELAQSQFAWDGRVKRRLPLGEIPGNHDRYL